MAHSIQIVRFSILFTFLQQDAITTPTKKWVGKFHLKFPSSVICLVLDASVTWLCAKLTAIA